MQIKKILKTLKKLYPNPKMALSYKNNWQLLVAVILSAQCTDKKVNEVTCELFKKYPKLEDYTKAKLSQFEKDIKSIGLYRSKAKNILSTAKIIKTEYNGWLPKTMEDMIKLPGVGRKTANVVLNQAFGIVME